jgi:ribosome-binding ATPase YchF (GTP1/OBG family)
MSELKEDIEEVKKLEFGRKIFEAVEAEFKKIRKEDLSSVESDLAEALDELNDAKKRLADMEQERLAEARSTKLEELLAPLSGTTREQMKIILSNVRTDKLDEAYNVYIGRILKESTSEKKDETKGTLTESKESKEVTLVTGNKEEVSEEDNKPSDQLFRLRKLAGLNH